jgi:Ca2+/H+ antiporter
VLLRVRVVCRVVLCCAVARVAWFQGFILLFGSLFVKTYRVNRIFGTKKLTSMKITDMNLMQALAVLLVAHAVYLGLWSGLSAPSPVSTIVSGVEYWECSSSTSFWPNILIIAEALLLLYGVSLAYEMRAHPGLFNGNVQAQHASSAAPAHLSSLCSFVVLVGVSLLLVMCALAVCAAVLRI